MTDLRAILAAVPELLAAGRPALLATVVRTRGSTYRKAGARMLLAADGWRLGTVSGGCVEADLIETAFQRVADAGNRPVVVEYDTQRDGDIIWGHGSGCAGTVEILLEPLVPTASARPADAALDFIAESLRERRPAVVATVVRVDDAGSSAPAAAGMSVGQRLLRREGAEEMATDEETGRALHAVASETLLARRSRHVELADGVIGVFCEYLPPPPALVVFGVGQDAAPVVRLARGLGWHVTVAGRRAALGAAKSLAAAADAFVPERAGVALVDGGTLALVMTHNYLADLGLLETLLPRRPLYLGLLGPRARRDRLLADLARDTGFVPTAEQLAALHAPAGLDLGAEGPEEIALAIVAEMRGVLVGRAGGQLRGSARPIHAGPGEP